MTTIMGVDPGATTGWCLWDTRRIVLGSGQFDQHICSATFIAALDSASMAVVEGFDDVHAGIYPQTVHAAVTCGRLLEIIERRNIACTQMGRMVIKSELQRAVHSEVRVQKDKDVWTALTLLHGPGSDKKPRVKRGVVVEPGGTLGTVRDHARAALAAAVAWHLRFAAATETL